MGVIWNSLRTTYAVITVALVVSLLSGSYDTRAEEAATYRLDVEIAWSAETHPHEFPESAHFSGLIGATHNSRYVLFADGQTASSGLELVAENGRPSILKAEMAEQTRRRRIGMVFESRGLAEVPGMMTATFTADSDHPFVSFATMVAPSPDWFTGVSGAALRDDGGWIDRLEVTLWAWDSGTDSGPTYTAPDMDTQPRESIRLIGSPHFLNATGLEPIGTAKFVRIE